MSIVKLYTKNGVDKEDLIQEGLIGVNRALETYDENKGAFSTYASIWIRQKIRRSIERTCRTVRLPSYVHQSRSKIHAHRMKIYKKTGEKPTIEDSLPYVKLKHNITNSHITSICEYDYYEDSMDREILDEKTVMNKFCGPLVDGKYEARHELSRIKYNLNRLSERNRKIIIKRWGLDTGDIMTLEEVGIEFGITRERVRQIEEMARKVVLAE